MAARSEGRSTVPRCRSDLRKLYRGGPSGLGGDHPPSAGTDCLRRLRTGYFRYRLGGPFVAETKGARHGSPTPWHAHHIAERSSLLAIIALGEMVFDALAAAQSITAAEGWSFASIAVVGLGVILAFALWWAYFIVPSAAILAEQRHKAFRWGSASGQLCETWEVDEDLEGSLHHIELWVPSLERAKDEWGWILNRLGYSPDPNSVPPTSGRQGSGLPYGFH